LAKEIAKKAEASAVTAAKLQEARDSYNGICDHCSLLFFILQRLEHLDSVYQYSLAWFLGLFTRSLDGFRADVVRQREVEMEAKEEQFYRDNEFHEEAEDSKHNRLIAEQREREFLKQKAIFLDKS